MDSSPPNLPSSSNRSSQQKQKRNASVTPRRFGKFFTPRSTSFPSARRRILASANDSSLNRQRLVEPLSPNSLDNDPFGSDPIIPSSPTDGLGASSSGLKRKRPAQPVPGSKRRSALFEDLLPQLPGSQTRESPVSQKDGCGSFGRQGKGRETLAHVFKARPSGVQTPYGPFSVEQSLLDANRKAPIIVEHYEPRSVRKLANRGLESQLLDREHGFSRHAGKQHLAYPACDYRAETASFYSRQYDLHHCFQAVGGAVPTIPFSLASCHKSPMTAIGDEDGFVRFFETTMTDDPAATKIRGHTAMHSNAIMDLAFSEDDLRLATASGDQSSRILDMATQRIITELKGGHLDSLRQVAFQPGPAGGNVLATSDKAGRVHIWDLRCSAAPLSAFSGQNPPNAHDYNSVEEPVTRSVNRLDNFLYSPLGREVHKSVNAIQWLPTGREHLLLTGSEASTAIKLWDTRYIRRPNQTTDTSLATTAQPASHVKGRAWGITSLALGGNGSRLYAVCKDSTVYAYSVPHLMLGLAPELDAGAKKRRPNNVDGLGPIYGFRHDSFRADTFYVKCAVRPADPHNGTSELLAVGSSNECAMLFPTDEKYMRAAWAKQAHVQSSGAPSLPISRAGTPLIRGHSREVAAVSWSHDGKLVTASDDFKVRQWQQGDGARYLRQCGEFGGERHMAGWADVSSDWDEDDD